MTTPRALKKLCAMRRRLADTAQLRGVRPFAEGICITAIRACLGAHDWMIGVLEYNNYSKYEWGLGSA
jgi:hypothetical protein